LRELIVAPPHDAQLVRYKHMTDPAERLGLYLALKRLPGTYANIPDDPLAMAKALSVDLFILYKERSLGNVAIQWYNPETMAEFFLSPRQRTYVNKIILQGPLDTGSTAPLPRLMSTVDDLGYTSASVPDSQLSEAWRSAIENNFFLPSVFFDRKRTVLIGWNGAEGLSGHHTLLSGPARLPALTQRGGITSFVEWKKWKVPLTSTARPMVFGTYDFLKRAVSHRSRTEFCGQPFPQDAGSAIEYCRSEDAGLFC
jgi:hypothetical protein